MGTSALDMREHGASHFVADGGGLENDYGVVGLDEGGCLVEVEGDGLSAGDAGDGGAVDGDDGVVLDGKDEYFGGVGVGVGGGTEGGDGVEEDIAATDAGEGEYLVADEVGVVDGGDIVVGGVDGYGFGGVDDGVVEVGVGGAVGGADAIGLSLLEGEEEGAVGVDAAHEGGTGGDFDLGLVLCGDNFHGCCAVER